MQTAQKRWISCHQNLKEYNPEELGRLLGLDRVAEVKTIRRKLARLAGYGRAAEFGRALAEQRVQSIDGRKRRYILADREVRLLKQTLRLRQVTRLLGVDGHQIGIVTSLCDLSAREVVYRLTERWRQENFFKYLRIEYALDALVDYGVESADEDRMVPNPECRKLNAEIQKGAALLDGGAGRVAWQHGFILLDTLEVAALTGTTCTMQPVGIGVAMPVSIERLPV